MSLVGNDYRYGSQSLREVRQYLSIDDSIFCWEPIALMVAAIWGDVSHDRALCAAGKKWGGNG